MLAARRACGCDRLREPGSGGRGLQRWRRLGVARLRRPRHARPRRVPGGHRGVAVAGRRRARRLRRAGRRVGPALDRGRDHEMDDAAYRINDGDRCFHCKYGADGRGRRRWPPSRGRHGGARRERRRPRATTGPGSAAAADAGAVFPLVEAGFTKADGPGGLAGAGSAHLGQAGRGLPGVAGALRHDRSPWPCCPGSSGPRPRCGGSGSSSCGCATTTTPPAWRCRSPSSAGVRRAARRASSPRCGRRATATSPSISRACGPATSTRRSSAEPARHPVRPSRFGRRSRSVRQRSRPPWSSDGRRGDSSELGSVRRFGVPRKDT